ncbi:polyprenyl synthetase family protein [Micromonospora sp. M12]
MVGLNLTDPRVEASVLGVLDKVEAELRASVSSADPFVNEAARHLVEAGGKRFRPLLVALGSQFGDPNGPQVIPAAVVMELTHLATLYHDDVMDEAAVRRARRARTPGGPTRSPSWSATTFARAADIAADLGPEAVRLQARTFARLVHGQIAETVGPRPGDDPVAHYLHVIAEKTGSLIATSVRFGGIFGGAAPEHVEALAGYGETIGVAFQLVDDLLDIASESEQSGKTPAPTCARGPDAAGALRPRGDDSDASSVRLREILATGPLTDDALHAEALGLLGRARRSSGSGRPCAATPRRPARNSVRSRAARPATRSSPSATTSPTAPADPPHPGPPGRRHGSTGGCRRA